MNYKRLENELEEEYIYRVCSEKEVIGSWQNIADILNKELGYEYTESKYRKQYQAYTKMFEANKHRYFDNSYLNELEEKQDEFYKQQVKTRDWFNAKRNKLRSESRLEEFYDLFKEAITNGNLVQLNYEPCKLDLLDNCEMLISLNDLHYGASTENYWNTYNPEVCAKRMCEYIDKIKEIQDKFKCKNAVVWCNGDVISGNIHKEIAVTNKLLVTQQIKGASELIAQFLEKLSPLFEKIRFTSVSGNHSRIEKKTDACKDERLDDLIEWWLSARLQKFENLLFGQYEDIDETLYIINVNGKDFAGIHGDYDKGVNSLLKLQNMTGRKIYGVLTAHNHHNKTDTIDGIKTLMAGSMQGMDNLCVTNRIYGYAEQIVSLVPKSNDIYNFDLRFN